MTRDVILLPAVRTRPADAIAAGFVAAAARQGDTTLTLVDVPLADLADRRGIDKAVRVPVSQALAAGRRPWIAGISLGAWLALLLASRQPGAFAGVALIAPWLGTRELQREFAAAGGLERWLVGASAETARGAAPAGSLEEERAAWRFLAAPGTLPVWLGYGGADRFHDAQSLAATLLPADRVYVVPGGAHDWPCWADIWEHFLRWPPP